MKTQEISHIHTKILLRSHGKCSFGKRQPEISERRIFCWLHFTIWAPKSSHEEDTHLTATLVVGKTFCIWNFTCSVHNTTAECETCQISRPYYFSKPKQVVVRCMSAWVNAKPLNWICHCPIFRHRCWALTPEKQRFLLDSLPHLAHVRYCTLTSSLSGDSMSSSVVL